MRIVHAGNFNEEANGAVFYSVDNKISNGLIRDNHYVYNFSYRHLAPSTPSLFNRKKRDIRSMRHRLLEVIDNIKPELLLLGHTKTIDNATLTAIRALQPGIKLAMWFVDDLQIRDNLSFLSSRAPLLDAIFCTTGGDILRSIEAPDERLFYLPNPVDRTIESLKNDEKLKFEYDLVFCGRDYLSTPGYPTRSDDLPKIVDALTHIRFAIRGSLGNPVVRGMDYIELLEQSKCCLNLSRVNDTPYYSSDRIVHATGNGLLTFSPKVPGLDALFTDKEVVYYDDVEDLKKKIDLYLQDDELRIATAKAGRLKAQSAYQAENITRYMLEAIFSTPDNDQYPWCRF